MSLIRNERYVGRIVWNKREFFRDPVTRKRRARLRPESDWVVTEAPELAIVPRELWDAAQERHRARRGGCQVNGKRTTRLLAGYLRCGACGSAMSIVAANTKRGVTYARYGCSANHGKGEAACPNNRVVSERKVDEMVLAGLEAYVQSDEFQGWLDDALAAAERARGRRGGAAELEIEGEVRAQQAKTERIAAAIVEVGVSETLRAALLREEERLRELRQRLTETRRRARPGPLPGGGGGPGDRPARGRRRRRGARPARAVPRPHRSYAGRRGRRDRLLRRGGPQKHDGRPGGRPVGAIVRRWPWLRGTVPGALGGPGAGACAASSTGEPRVATRQLGAPERPCYPCARYARVLGQS